MKYIINKCYGGYGIKDNIIDYYNISDDNKDEYRTNPILIELIEKGIDINDNWAKLKVVEIPDDATDWTLEEYDGLEEIIFVQNGKLHYL